MLKAGEYSPNNPLVRGERGTGDALLGLGEYERRRNTLRKLRQQQYREYLDQAEVMKTIVIPSAVNNNASDYVFGFDILIRTDRIAWYSKVQKLQKSRSTSGILVLDHVTAHLFIMSWSSLIVNHLVF
ncbi:hypothetical protein MSG28_012802 [Choristoneura fumiferana]|uniref:Uncharacterized protein n=1 Tax=Choristoneura fumiferana TaxID=7141 RepID=A0ACC0JI35_CHOFU|nr:hypothetical protein MSG28_012802 [Choristoneura fumiferana]